MIIGLIPARGGSKGIKKKNIKDFCGKPLIYWTIKQALESKCLDRVIVSTDNSEIAEISSNYGAEVPFLRPKELASDQASSISTVIHLIDTIPKIKSILFLQPTSPLRNISDIEGIISLQEETNSQSIISMTEVTEHPSLMFRLNKRKISPIMNEKIKQR